MTIHTAIGPAKGRSTRVRKAAEASIQAGDFNAIMAPAMAAAQAFQDACAGRKRAHDQREAISPWSDYIAAQNAAQDAVAFPAILEVDGGPFVGSAGAIVAMVRQNPDGSEQRIELGSDIRKTKLMTRDAITAHCAGDPGLAQPMLSALEKYHAARRAAARAVFNAMPKKWRELSKEYDRATTGIDRVETQMMRDVYAALKFPTANPDHVRQKVELISLAFKGEMPTSLHRPDRARRSYEPEEILAVTLGATIQTVEGPLPQLSSARQDAELIRLGREFDTLDQELLDAVGNAEREALVTRQDPLVQRIKQLRATTVAGIQTKARMLDHHIPDANELAGTDLHVEIARSIVDDLLAMAIPTEWSKVMTVRPNDPELADVIRYAISQGHLAEELAQVVYASDVPGYAPALFFEKPDGDLVTVNAKGTYRAFGYARGGYDPESCQWESLAVRLDEIAAQGSEIDRHDGALPPDKVSAWVKADRDVMADIEALPARSIQGLKIKARAVVACYGASATVDDVSLADDPTTDVRLAEQIIRTLALM